jgi:hypothetical protein
VTLAAAVTNLKRLLVACGNRMVFIITPGPRYHTIPCCCSGDHCTHLQIPESGIKLMQDLARLHLFIARRLSSSSNCSVLPATPLQRKPWLPSLRGGRYTVPAPTTRGWHSVWLTVISARRPRRRRPLRSPLLQLRLPKDLVRIRPLHTSPGWMPACLFRHCPASGPRPASNRLEAASCTSLCSPGAAPAAANEAALTLPSRKASAAAREPPAEGAAEPPFCVSGNTSPRFIFCCICKIIFVKKK